MNSLYWRRLKRRIFLYTPLFLTLVWWVNAKVYLDSEVSISQIPRLLSQILALWGFVLLSMSFILSVKSQFLESIFGGLDQVFRIHSKVGKVAFSFIIAHVLLLVVYYWGAWDIVVSLFVPFVAASSTAKVFGITGFYGFILLISITIFRFLPYGMWKKTHRFLGLPFFLAAAHGLLAESDIKYYEPLVSWFAIWLFLGTLSYVYSVFWYKAFAPKYQYKVSRLLQLGERNWELRLMPIGARLNYEPGQFVYISFPESNIIGTELHPFSIFSDPSKNELVISFKILGDYTAFLPKARIGEMVHIYGPFGEFTSYLFNEYKHQVWVAGGIGVTPFISMFRYEVHNGDKKNIDFYYVGRFKKERLYTDLIKKEMQNADDVIRYYEYCSETNGRFSVKVLKQNMKGNIEDTLFLMCAPTPMMKSLEKQLIKMGVPRNNIVFEQFGFV